MRASRTKPSSYSTRDYLCAAAELLIEVRQHESVSNVLVVLDSGHRLAASFCTEWDLLDPALDILLRSKLKHGLHLRPVANVRSSDVATVWREVLGHDLICKVSNGERIASGVSSEPYLRQRCIRQSAGVKAAHNLERAEVVRQVEVLQDVGRIHDEVQSEGKRLVPILL